MRKFLTFLSSTFILTVAPLNIIACGNNNSTSNEIIPSWVHNMVKNNQKQQFNIGYNHYLINDVNAIQKTYDQHDWLNMAENNQFYIHLPEADNIDQAILNIAINDTASPKFTIGIINDLTWHKVNATTYTNNNFITEDTTIHGISTMNSTKYNEIKNSNMSNTWTEKEKNNFNNYGTMLASADPASGRKDQNWWNDGGWTKLLSSKKNLSSNKKSEENQKFSQLDLYNRWIGQKQIGMNVPLSLIAENSFTLKTTSIKHVFSLSVNIQQVWVSQAGKLIYIPTPHWGFALLLKNNKQQTVFWSTTLINLKNAFKENDMQNYLLQKEFLSFNNQKDKFANLYIE